MLTDAIISDKANKLSFAMQFCQHFLVKFYRHPRDHNVHRHRKTVSMSVYVYFLYPTGLIPGG